MERPLVTKSASAAVAMSFGKESSPGAFMARSLSSCQITASAGNTFALANAARRRIFVPLPMSTGTAAKRAHTASNPY